LFDLNNKVFYDTFCISLCMIEETVQKDKKQSNAYTFEDAMKVADDIFQLSKDKKYHIGAFVHGLIFALEATQQSYKIPPKQIAEVKRGARKYLQQLSDAMTQQQTKQD